MGGEVLGPKSSSCTDPLQRSCPLLSAAYIKVYLLENGVCVAKKKTKSVRKSLDPLYNQVLVFSERPQGKVVQVRPKPSHVPPVLKEFIKKREWEKRQHASPSPFYTASASINKSHTRTSRTLVSYHHPHHQGALMLQPRFCDAQTQAQKARRTQAFSFGTDTA